MAAKGARVHVYGDWDGSGIKKAQKDIGVFQQQVDGFGGQIKKSFSGIGIAIGAAVAGAGVALGKFAMDSISAASDLAESQSKVDAVFKDSADAVNEWADNSALAFGQSKQQALEAAGTYGNLFQAFGLSADAAQEMSTTMVELAADLASFNNTSIDDALEALRSGLSGETEPLKRFGVALTDARMRAEALAQGIYDGAGALDAGQRAQAAYALILKDTSLAQGDFARTSDGLANTQRILQAAVNDAKAEIGKGLVDAITDVIGVMGGSKGMVAQIQDATKQIADFTVGLGVVIREAIIFNRNLAIATNGLIDFAKAARLSLAIGTVGISELLLRLGRDIQLIGEQEQEAQRTTEAWADYRRAQQGVINVTPAVVDSLNATADAAAGAARNGAAAARALLEYSISTGQVPSAARFAQRFDVAEMLSNVGKASSAAGSSARGASKEVEKLDRRVKTVLPELAALAGEFGIKVNNALKIKGDKEFLESVKTRFDALRQRVDQFTTDRQSFEDDVRGVMSSYLSIATAAEAYQARQKAVFDAEAELAEYRRGLTDEVTEDQKAKLADLQLAYDNASKAARDGAQSIVEEFVQQSEKFGEFGRKMQQLLAAGLNKTSFMQILNMGAERGMEVADYYLTGNTTELVNRTNQTMQAYDELSKAIAKQSADAFYQAGLQSVVRLVQAFIETLGTGGAARRQLRSLVDSLQKELEVNVAVNFSTQQAWQMGAVGGGGGTGGGGGPAPEPTPTPTPAAAPAPRPLGAYTPPTPTAAPRIPSGEGRIFAELQALNRGRAEGGPVSANQLYMVGEVGPELFVPSVSGTIVSNKDLGGGATNITINVNAGMGTNGAEVGRQIVEAISAYEKRNGKLYASA